MSEHGSGQRVLDPMAHDSARQALLDVRHEVSKAVVGQDATVTTPQDRFVGQERPPLVRSDTPGTWVTLAMALNGALILLN